MPKLCAVFEDILHSGQSEHVVLAVEPVKKKKKRVNLASLSIIVLCG